MLVEEKVYYNSNNIKLCGILNKSNTDKFEEIRVMNGFNSAKFNHATYASKMLFEKNLIRKFIEDDKYDYIEVKLNK